MGKQEGSVGPQDPRIWEQALKEMGAPNKNEIYIKGVYDARNRFISGSEEKGGIFPDGVNGVKTLIKTEIGPEDPTIRGPVEIARGEELILGMTPSQEEAFAIVYGMDLDSEVSYHALIKNPRKSQEAKEALIKYCDVMPASVDHLIISKALAEKLGVKKGQDIRVLSVYRKTSDINLDEL